MCMMELAINTMTAERMIGSQRAESGTMRSLLFAMLGTWGRLPFRVQEVKCRAIWLRMPLTVHLAPKERHLMKTMTTETNTTHVDRMSGPNSDNSHLHGW